MDQDNPFPVVSPIGQSIREGTGSLGPSMQECFVGRQRQMAALHMALAEALAGHGRLVLLAGEPGIGKTRTVRELTASAGQRQVQVLQ